MLSLLLIFYRNCRFGFFIALIIVLLISCGSVAVAKKPLGDVIQDDHSLSPTESNSPSNETNRIKILVDEQEINPAAQNQNDSHTRKNLQASGGPDAADLNKNELNNQELTNEKSDTYSSDNQAKAATNAHSSLFAVRHPYTPLSKRQETSLGLYENPVGESLLDDSAVVELPKPSEEGIGSLQSSDGIRCSAEIDPRFSYRKRVAVLPMELQNRKDAVDIPYIEQEYSQALTERLNETGFLAVDASAHYRLEQFTEQSRLQSMVNPAQIRSVASALNSQFIVTGRLEDLSFDKTKVDPVDLITRLKSWRKVGQRTYEGITNSYQRQFNMVVNVYDGPSGVLINQNRYRGEANHKIQTQRNYGMDTNIFWQSDYGELIAEVLDKQTQFIAHALECLPMRAQVLRVANDIVEIDAGGESLLMPGDRLRIFHREPAERDLIGEPQYRWRYYGGVTVVGVFPLKAIVKLDINLAVDKIRTGDIVQAW